MAYYPLITVASGAGVWVEYFQEQLSQAGYPVTVTGHYDEPTRIAAKLFADKMRIPYSSSTGGVIEVNSEIWSALLSYNIMIEAIPDTAEIETAMAETASSDNTEEKAMNISSVSTTTESNGKYTLLKLGMVIGIGYFILSSVFGKRG